MFLHYLTKKENTEHNIAKDTYKIILKKSNIFLNNNNFFFKKDYNTSFEIVSIYIILYIKSNIHKKDNNFKLINENLINLFVSDLDESLRVKGIGDMSIGKYVKKYVKKFYFRLSQFPKEILNYNSLFLVDYLKLIKFTNKDDYENVSKKFYDEFNKIL